MEHYDLEAVLPQSYAADLQDHLRKLAVKEGPLAGGTRYWARQALTSVLSHLQAIHMKQILANPEAAYMQPEVGALMVVRSLTVDFCMLCRPRFSNAYQC